MKFIAFTWLVVASAHAQTTSDPAPAPAPKPVTRKAPPKTKPVVTQKPAAPGPVLPAGATLVEPNTYRYVDSDGKVWMYRKTPFGFSKWEDTPSPAPQAAAPSSDPDKDLVTVKDLGDTVRFERKTPFGATQWVRKKSELSDDEKAMLDKTAEKQEKQ